MKTNQGLSANVVGAYNDDPFATTIRHIRRIKYKLVILHLFK